MTAQSLLFTLAIMILTNVGVFFSGVDIGRDRAIAAAEQKANFEKAKLFDATLKVEAANRHILELQKTINARESIEHDKANQKIKVDSLSLQRAAVLNGGLRITGTCDRVKLSTIANGDSGSNADIASAWIIPEEYQRNLWAEAERAEQVTEQARACQKWIRAQGFYPEAVTTTEKANHETIF
jgi:hypothetical protein